MPVDADAAALSGAIDQLNRTGALWATSGDELDAGVMGAAHGIDALLSAPHDGLMEKVEHAAVSVRLARPGPWEEVRLVIARQANRIGATLGAASSPSPHWPLMCAAIRHPALNDPLVADLPEDDATVEQLHAWWTSLDQEAKDDAIRRYRSTLGRVDGIPIPVRGACNRPQLDVAISATRIEIRRLESIAATGRRRRAGQWRRLRRERRKLAGLETIRNRVDALEATGREVFLVDLDWDGTGSATIAINNPDTADRVVTYLPGGGTSLAKAGGCLDDSTNLLNMIERLDFGEEPMPKTAMITRIYRVPEILAVGVLLADHAADEAAKYCRFQHSLHVTHAGSDERPDEEAHYGIVTHSYGGVTGAMTDLLYGADADVMSLNGPPGAVADHADEFSVPKVYATTKDHDLLIALARPRLIHNRRPSDPEFGARIFTSEPGQRWPLPGGWSVSAHFDYFRTDLLSLYNNAQVCRGHEPIPSLRNTVLD